VTIDAPVEVRGQRRLRPRRQRSVEQSFEKQPR
jgi:hypothetical protein